MPADRGRARRSLRAARRSLRTARRSLRTAQRSLRTAREQLGRSVCLGRRAARCRPFCAPQLARLAYRPLVAGALELAVKRLDAAEDEVGGVLLLLARGVLRSLKPERLAE